MEKLGTVAIGALASLMALAGGLETFSGAALHWRLIIAGIACACLSWAMAVYLGFWLKPTRSAGFTAPVGTRSGIKALASVATLGILALLCVWLSWFFLIDRTTFQWHETMTGRTARTLLVAPYAKVDSLTVELPPNNDATCDWANQSPATARQLQLATVDSDTPVPKLELDNFEYPQRLEITCTDSPAVRNITTKPVVAVYRAGDLSWWRIISGTMGGLIWLIACIRLFFS